MAGITTSEPNIYLGSSLSYPFLFLFLACYLSFPFIRLSASDRARWLYAVWDVITSGGKIYSGRKRHNRQGIESEFPPRGGEEAGITALLLSFL